MNKTDAMREIVGLLAEFVRSEADDLAERLANAFAALLAPGDEPAPEDEPEPVKKTTRRR
jgi:hypothetical protein